MRTTIELSDPLYRRLREVAIERGMRGFSPIVEEALSEYLDAGGHLRDPVAAVEAAEGLWNDQDVEELERRRRLAWSGWRAHRP